MSRCNKSQKGKQNKVLVNFSGLVRLLDMGPLDLKLLRLETAKILIFGEPIATFTR